MKLLKSVFVEYPVVETYLQFKLGEQSFRGIPVELLYNEPRGEGDAHYVDVKFDDNRKIRLFRPDEIEFLVDV